MPKYPLTINSRGNGMSSDEFVGGDFLVGNKVDIFNNTQSFKLSKKTTKVVINNRANGITRDAIYAPTFGAGLVMLSNDGHIENLTSRKTSVDTVLTPTSNNYGAIYRRATASLIGYKTVTGGDDVFVVSSNKLDRLEFTSGIDSGGVTTTTNLVTNPGLTSDTGWTVGSGRTTGVNGAEHTSGGGTAALTQSITPSGATGKYRLVVRITNHTTGTVDVQRRGVSQDIISADTTGRLTTMVYDFGGAGAGDLSFVPTSLFNGRVNYVVLYEYTSALNYDEVTLSGTEPKAWIISGGRLYIGNSNFVDIIDTTLSTWVLLETLELPGDQDVVGITEIGDTINIYARDGVNGYKYLWNGVDIFPAEKITREGLRFDSVDNDGNSDMVMCSDGIRTYIYVTSGREKQLLYNSTYKIFSEDVLPQANLWEIHNRLFTPSNGRGITNGGGFTAITGIDYIYMYGQIYPGIKGGVTKFESVGEYPTDTIPFVKYLNSIFYTTYINPAQTGTKDNQIMYWNMLANSAIELNRDGYVITKPTLRDNASSFKSLEKIKLGYRTEFDGNQIEIYARVDDYKYITFYCDGISVYPTKGAIYNIDLGTLGTLEVISTDSTQGTVSGLWTQSGAYSFIDNIPNILPIELTKASGTGDATIDITDLDHFIKIKTITAVDGEFGGFSRTVILGRDKLDIELPERQKAQFKIRLYQGLEGGAETTSPEVFDFGVLSSVVKDA